MTFKKFIIGLLSIFSLFSVVFALSQSVSQLQVQYQLELYQTNLLLNVAEFKGDKNEQISNNLQSLADSLVGVNPYQTAEKQYIKALNGLDNYSSENVANLVDTPRKNLAQSNQENGQIINEIKLKLGIIKAVENNVNKASQLWQEIPTSALQTTINNLWLKPELIEENSQEIIENNLKDWFKLTALKQLYTVTDNQRELSIVAQQQQELAQKAMIRLLSLSIIPFVGGVTGAGLLIFLIIQWLLKKDQGILATNSETSWQLPWDREIILQVLVVGFFFISQFVLPILFSVSGISPLGLDIRGKAFYVLLSYAMMAGSGLLVLYFSIKPFFPLPEGWFKWVNKNWLWWGLGGYVVAIPLVFLVSVINQQLWQGKGGSNPLLLLALESQDKITLLIFFVTASILAPFYEEIMFRGFLLPSLTRYVSVTGAIIISGLIFALAHLSLAEVLPLTVLGILLGVVYTRSRSLFASILVHSLWNSGTLFSLFTLGSNLS